uniref:Uncharacterized protein n=1 Tax=Anguilla anguilla TaxID=7936 RepID=A0A0E9VW01_ANGAN
MEVYNQCTLYTVDLETDIMGKEFQKRHPND